MGSPGPSDIETGIEWNRMRPEAKALPGSHGSEGISVSIGCDIRKLWKRKYAVGSEVGPLFSWTVPCRGFEGTSVSMGCENRKLWKGVMKI